MNRVPLLLAAACSSSAELDGLPFPTDFRFGAATAAHQIEGNNTNNDWWQFETLPEFEGRTAEPSGGAAGGYERFEGDAQLAADLGLSVYRMSIEWSRVEPQRGVFDEGALAHYRRVFEALRARGLAPSVTLHHFTSPIWVQDMRDLDCADGPSDANLCGWSNSEVAVAFEEFAARVAGAYGDLVDEWVTLNEPNGLVISGYVLGVFPPTRMALSVAAAQEFAVPALRNTLDAHARAYDAVHANDTADADGDGEAARVGIAISMMHYEGAPADDPDVAAANAGAAERARYLYNHLYPDALRDGTFDTDLDGEPDEDHPEWREKLDFLGFQYYARIFVVESGLGFPPLDLLPCVGSIDDFFGEGFAESLGCPAPQAPDWVEIMGYEHYPAGIAAIARDLAERYPWDLVATENGIATRTGRRRAQSVVRHLAELQPLVAEGVPLRGYYHWSLIDNFEWVLGFEPRFGLYTVDYDTLSRTVTEGALTYGVIAAARRIPQNILDQYGAEAGPLEPETEQPAPDGGGD